MKDDGRVNIDDHGTKTSRGQSIYGCIDRSCEWTCNGGGRVVKDHWSRLVWDELAENVGRVEYEHQRCLMQ